MKILALCAFLFAGVVQASVPNAPSNFNLSASPISLSVSGLHIVGNEILNNLNQHVQLRGVNKSGPEYMCTATNTSYFDGPSDANSVTVLQSWAINAVRIQLNEQCWLGINGLPAFGSAAAYRTAIVNYVNLLNAGNIAVVLDLQWNAPGTTVANQQIAMPDADHAPAFWSSVATTFASNPSVLFDLFNEPYADNNADTVAAWTCNRDGGTCPGVTFQVAGFQGLLNTIRGAGATNIVIASGVQYANSLSQWLTYEPIDSLSPPQVAASWHSYSVQSCAPLSCWQTNILPVAKTVPVLALEIGENDCQTTYINQLMPWLDGVGGNYFGWVWLTTACSGGDPGLISDYAGTPTNYGVGLRNHLLALSGRTVPAATAPSTYFSTTFPKGIAVGRATNYTANDGTVYVGDNGSAVPGASFDFTTYGFPAYSTGATITGTADPTLYQTGRWGSAGTWNLNVPNGNYTVTISAAPLTTYTQSTFNDATTASIDNLGEFGQTQNVQGNQLGSCVWSSYPNGNVSPYSSPSTSCPQTGGTAVPVVDAVVSISYTVDVSNYVLSLFLENSFGNFRKTIVNAIKIVQNTVPVAPATPIGLAVTAGSALANVSWTTTSSATSYNVLRSIGTRGFYKAIAGPLTNSYSDNSLTNGTNYCYKVQAVNAAGVSAATASPICVTPGSVAPPGIPAGVTATPGAGAVNLAWTTVSGATSYYVNRATSSAGTYGVIAQPTANSYSDSTGTVGTTYYYKIQALNAGGTSGFSSIVSGAPTAAVAGTWVNVTPGGPNLTNANLCGTPGNFGTQTVGHDSASPNIMYSSFDSYGIYKSTDYGATWNGPVNTGALASTINNSCGAGVTVGANGVLYFAAIRGTPGLYKSTNGGVDWTQLALTPLPGNRQDVYPPQIDPYNASHLLVSGHEQSYILESNDAGATWAALPIATSGGPSGNGMNDLTGGTGFTFFINTGTASTTAQTFLWIAQWNNNTYGTWRTTNRGVTWTFVQNNEHAHGTAEIYQPNLSGDLYMTGLASSLGSGILHSSNYGATWALTGTSTNESLVTGTSKNLYAMYGWAIGMGSNVAADYQTAPKPAAGVGGTWTSGSLPSGIYQGGGYLDVVNNGTNNIIVGAMWGAGLWRYIEP